MNRLLVRTALLAGALALAASASHALPFSGSFSFQLGTFPPLTFAASGSGASFGEVSSGGIVPGSDATPLQLSPITQLDVVVSGNGTGTLPGPLSVQGEARMDGFGGVTVIRIPFFTDAGGRTAGGATSVSAGLGVGNTIQTTGTGGSIVQVFHGAWTTGTTTVELTRTVSGAPTAVTATAMGGVFGSRLVAVAPVGVSTSFSESFHAFATLDLTYVPEPGTLALLASGAVALAVLGRRRT